MGWNAKAVLQQDDDVGHPWNGTVWSDKHSGLETCHDSNSGLELPSLCNGLYQCHTEWPDACSIHMLACASYYLLQNDVSAMELKVLKATYGLQTSGQKKKNVI